MQLTYSIFLLSPSAVFASLFSPKVRLLLSHIQIVVGYVFIFLCRTASSAVVVIHYLSSWLFLAKRTIFYLVLIELNLHFFSPGCFSNLSNSFYILILFSNVLTAPSYQPSHQRGCKHIANLISAIFISSSRSLGESIEWYWAWYVPLCICPFW